jgi:uncharacterized protein YdhG (YjbR/CyaY superfamily)
MGAALTATTIAARMATRIMNKVTKSLDEQHQPKTVDEYIARFEPKVQALLQKVRRTVRKAAPRAREVISYSMPALKQNGILIYFAAFKSHIGFYPPTRGDAKLEKAAARYAGAKGNLRFPFAEPIPYALIASVTKLRARQDAAKAVTRSRARRAAPSRARR